MIADFDFYQNTYLGDVLTSETFPKYATRADAYLDEITMGRYEDEDLTEAAVKAVKMAECAAAEVCYSNDQTAMASATVSAGILASESVGSHSVSYRSGVEIQQQEAATIRNLAQRHLGRYGLLYRGIGVHFGRRPLRDYADIQQETIVSSSE